MWGCPGFAWFPSRRQGHSGAYSMAIVSWLWRGQRYMIIWESPNHFILKPWRIVTSFFALPNLHVSYYFWKQSCVSLRSFFSFIFFWHTKWQHMVDDNYWWPKRVVTQSKRVQFNSCFELNWWIFGQSPLIWFQVACFFNFVFKEGIPDMMFAIFGLVLFQFVCLFTHMRTP